MNDTDREMVELECRLTIAHSINRGCECGIYFVNRRDVLIPAVLEHAEQVGVDPIDDFARYARGVHARHEAGLSLAVSA